MATIAQRIKQELKHGDALDDAVLAKRLGVMRQSVNQTARHLEARGELRHYTGADGKIVNQLSPGAVGTN